MKFAKTLPVFALTAVFTLLGPMLTTARPVASSVAQAQSAKPAPPEDSPELFRAMEFRFQPQGEQPQRDYKTYFEMMEGIQYVSKPSLGEWIPYASAEEVVVADAERLWRSGLLDSIWVDVTDRPYENGVAGKHVIFNFVESSQNQTLPYPGESPVPAPGFEAPAAGHDRLYPQLEVDLGILERYIGQYRLSDESVVTIRLEEGQLTAQWTYVQKAPLVAVSEIGFVVEAPIDRAFSFNLNGAGEVESLSMHAGGEELIAPRID